MSVKEENLPNYKKIKNEHNKVEFIKFFITKTLTYYTLRKF